MKIDVHKVIQFIRQEYPDAQIVWEGHPSRPLIWVSTRYRGERLVHLAMDTELSDEAVVERILDLLEEPAHE